MSAVALCERQISTELGCRRWSVRSRSRRPQAPCRPQGSFPSPLNIAQRRRPGDRGILERRVYLPLSNLASVKGKYEVIGSFSLHQNQ